MLFILSAPETFLDESRKRRYAEDVAHFLVVGATGQTGEQIVSILRSRGKEVVGTGLRHGADVSLDLKDDSAVDSLIERTRPRVIFIPGGMTNVDDCERQPERALTVNARAPGRIARAAKRANAFVVYFSTDYVFDGAAGPYGECDSPNPINHYGRSKLEGERLVAESGARHSILRTCVVYSYKPGHANFFMQVYSKLSAGQKVTPFQDQFVNPTYAPALAEAAIDVAEGELSGLLHVGGADWVSRVDFCRRIVSRFGFSEKLLEPVDTAQVALPAKRPLKAGLKIDLARARGVRLTGLDDALADIARNRTLGTN